MSLPWQRLLDAQIEAQDALRTDDAGRQAAALEELNAARAEMGCVGGLLILMALEHGGLLVQKKIARVFGELAAGAYEKAQIADRRATEALELLDMMKCRVRELERRLEKSQREVLARR